MADSIKYTKVKTQESNTISEVVVICINLLEDVLRQCIFNVNRNKVRYRGWETKNQDFHSPQK